MAKKMKKPAPSATEGGEMGSIWDHFGVDTPANQQAAPAAAAATDSAALLARMDAMEVENKAYREANDRMMRQPVTVQQQQGTPVDPATIKFDPTGLPDPYTNQKEYDRQLAERINATVEAKTFAVKQELTQQFQQQGQQDRLWTEFSSKYAQWAAYPDLVGAVAEKLAKKAKASGVDVNRYLFASSEQFYQDIANDLTKNYSGLLKEEGEEDDTTQQRPVARTGFAQHGDALQTEDPEGRTAGIFGGQESGGKPATGRAAPKGDMIKDIQDLQRASGFF